MRTTFRRRIPPGAARSWRSIRTHLRPRVPRQFLRFRRQQCLPRARRRTLMHGFAPIEDFVPHRGAMLLLREVLACDGDSITVGATVPRAAWYLDEHGAMPAWIGLELM